MTPNYETWSKEELIGRLTELELRAKAAEGVRFHFKDRPLRKIAVKFCYSGWEYNGLAYQIDPTPLPTVEEVLFQAFAKARLVDAEAGLDGCGWERCGRTDVGVSAAGQVVSLWVRSALPVNGAKPPEELHYVSILNRVLPPTIRVLAWSPVSPDFSARFNCQHRHYKYFFTSHDLDVSLMQQAASYLLGEHDFRNLSKIDPAKQITDFRRRIMRADISPNKVYVFDLVGSAFLYHQVRHIMAILFLVGTGLEPPSIIPTLMNSSGSSLLPIVDRKPEYQMADGLPLMLWDCAYADSDVRWQTDHERGGGGGESGSGTGLYHQLHSVHQRSLIHVTLEDYFLAAAARYHPSPPQHFPFSETGLTTSTIPPLADREPAVLAVPLGGGTYRRGVKYVPLLSRKRLDHVQVVNERWRNGKGSRRGEKMGIVNTVADDE
ncbi:pseudouridine synthase [Melanogaster broomeanus]|nr:pseudouridine synthase [Melanogaster broomeanus]